MQKILCLSRGIPNLLKIAIRRNTLCMPILTLRLQEAELEAIDHAAERAHLNRSEFAKRALKAAATPEKKTASIRGALKGRFTYKQAMKLLRG